MAELCYVLLETVEYEPPDSDSEEEEEEEEDEDEEDEGIQQTNTFYFTVTDAFFKTFWNPCILQVHSGVMGIWNCVIPTVKLLSESEKSRHSIAISHSS